MRASWLADVLRGAGLTVVEVPGWRGRGRELGGIDGVVIHDTVTTKSTSDQAAADLLRDGRRDLAGPLSQLGLDRSGRLWLIADGRCNHNGYGEWGNSAIGIEVFCAGGLSGHEEPQTELQQAIGARAAAAILHQVGLPPSRCKGHKETDPGRKIDPYKVDMDHYRRRVAGSQGADEVTEEDLKKLGQWEKDTRAEVIAEVTDVIEKQTNQIDRFAVWQMRQAGVPDADIKRILGKSTLPAA